MDFGYVPLIETLICSFGVLLLILCLCLELWSQSWKKNAGKVVDECYMPYVDHRILGVATLADGSHVITTAPVSDASDIRAYKLAPGAAPMCGSVVARLYNPQTRDCYLAKVG